MKHIITIMIVLLAASSGIQAQGLGGPEREVKTKRAGVALQTPFLHGAALDVEQQSQVSKYRAAADLADRCTEALPQHIGCEDSGWVARKLGSKLSKSFPNEKRRTSKKRQQWAGIRRIQTQLIQVELRAMLVRGNTGRGL